MAYKIKKICAKAGCNNYATHGAYCEEHKKEQNRGTTSKFASFYSKTIWKKARLTFLTRPENMYCAKCLEKGIKTPSNTVHHKFGFKDFNTFMDTSKWVGWCDSCHSSYHTTITNEQLYEQNKENW